MKKDKSRLSRRAFLRRTASLAATPAILAALPAAAATAKRPNIILCMGDDHGWHEVGYRKHPHLRTPTLDDMASRGLRFDQFYAAAPVCSPTRGSIMTGRHPNRYGTFAPNFSIRPEEITIAHLLRKAGYTCGHFGKWHLGPNKAGSPTNPGAMGFHHWLSHDNFFGYNPRFVRDGAPPERFPGESSEVVVENAIEFIKKASADNKPFFTVVWFGSPHDPYAAIDEDVIPYKDLDPVLAQRFGEITAMDRAIGRLRTYLREANLTGNTLFWYCSDNGTPGPSCVDTELRGSKGNLYEGGIRVPSIIEWPAAIGKPAITDVPAVTSDMLPTLCDLLDLPLPDRPLDGISLKPLLEGRMKERPKPICFWQYDRRDDGEQYIDPKLQHGTVPTSKVYDIQFRNGRFTKARTSGFGGMAAVVDNRYKLVAAPKTGQLELYDLKADLSEKNDLAASQPDVVKKMEGVLRDWQRSVEVSLTAADYRK